MQAIYSKTIAKIQCNTVCSENDFLILPIDWEIIYNRYQTTDKQTCMVLEGLLWRPLKDRDMDQLISFLEAWRSEPELWKLRAQDKLEPFRQTDRQTNSNSRAPGRSFKKLGNWYFGFKLIKDTNSLFNYYLFGTI